LHTLDYAFVAFGVAGILFGINAYVHLWKWARMCQRATIAIAYGGRVKMNAPLTEWLTWCNMLKGSEARGRTVFKMNKMSVSILRPEANMSAKTTFKKIRRFRRAKKTTAAT
jgi:hypothetical protein